MEIDNCLPILLVSAKNKEAAEYIISNVIDTKSEDIGRNHLNATELDCVWKIENKYYTANVWVHVLLDGENLATQIAHLVEAHLIYLTEDEGTAESAAETMQRRSVAGAAAHVRVAALDAAAEPPPLAAACARARLELVPLRAPPAGDDDDDDAGAARLRAALHAHVWPGLRRRAGLSAGSGAEAEDSDGEWSEWQAAEDAYCAALASLPGAAAAARGGGGSREERLQRAEALVAAFCRALGTPFD